MKCLLTDLFHFEQFFPFVIDNYLANAIIFNYLVLNNANIISLIMLMSLFLWFCCVFGRPPLLTLQAVLGGELAMGSPSAASPTKPAGQYYQHYGSNPRRRALHMDPMGEAPVPLKLFLHQKIFYVIFL